VQILQQGEVPKRRRNARQLVAVEVQHLRRAEVPERRRQAR
jgi:hypothetical protein